MSGKGKYWRYTHVNCDFCGKWKNPELGQIVNISNDKDNIEECEDEGEIARYETFVEVLEFIKGWIEMEYIPKTKRIKKKTKHWREAKEMEQKFISSE
jgi:hypothetical protein